MESQSSRSRASSAEPWIALFLCAAVLLNRVVEHILSSRPAHTPSLAPDWLPLAALGLAAAGIVPSQRSPQWLRVRRVALCGGLLLMMWVANGLPFDLFAMARLMPWSVDWPGLATRTLALAAAVLLAHLALARPHAPASTRAGARHGYAAFFMALPYPLLRTHWAMGGTLGLEGPGAAGKGFAPLLLAIPFLLAASLSLLLASPRPSMPRRSLLAAGWTAAAIMAMIGPAACWMMVATLVSGRGTGANGIAVWVFCAFYASWLLFAIAEGAATRSYQLRSAHRVTPSPR